MLRLLSEEDRWRYETAAQNSFLSGEPREGFFRLFNKNRWTTTYVKPVSQVPHKFLWVVECDVIDPYFEKVLQEFIDEPDLNRGDAIAQTD
jgi:hypothetical protein